MRIVILYSGGLDSLIMAEYAKEHNPNDEVIKVFFDIGQEYGWKERAALPPDVIVHDMKWYQAQGVDKEGINSGSIFIPGRNQVFITIAACKYLPDEIWLGALQGEIHDKATDKNFKFRDMMTETLSYVLSPFKEGGVRVRFRLAERGWGKLEATRWACSHGMKEAILASSSCMHPDYDNCGECVVCLRRWGIFTQLGLKEDYVVDPVFAKSNQKMLLEMIDSLIGLYETHYDEYRLREILPALELRFPDKDLIEIREIIRCGSIPMKNTTTGTN